SENSESSARPDSLPRTAIYRRNLASSHLPACFCVVPLLQNAGQEYFPGSRRPLGFPSVLLHSPLSPNNSVRCPAVPERCRKQQVSTARKWRGSRVRNVISKPLGRPSRCRCAG